MENVKSKRVGSPENAENEDGGSDKGLLQEEKNPPPPLHLHFLTSP